MKMVANRVPFEIYGRHPQKLNPDPGVVDGKTPLPDYPGVIRLTTYLLI